MTFISVVNFYPTD